MPCPISTLGITSDMPPSGEMRTKPPIALGLADVAARARALQAKATLRPPTIN
jgi:hypothetical protein